LGRIVILILTILSFFILRDFLGEGSKKVGCSFKSVEDKREELGLSSDLAVAGAGGEILDY
jgi:hypothetical protein